MTSLPGAARLIHSVSKQSRKRRAVKASLLILTAMSGSPVFALAPESGSRTAAQTISSTTIVDHVGVTILTKSEDTTLNKGRGAATNSQTGSALSIVTDGQSVSGIRKLQASDPVVHHFN